MANCFGVLVAGGHGLRLGAGVPKARVEVGGRTLLERALATLATCCGPVVIAAPATLDLGTVPVPVVHDPPGDEIPLGGVVAGLGAHPGMRAIVLGVDFPLLQPDALRGLLDAHDREPSREAVIPSPGGFRQPLCAVYSGAAHAVLAGRLADGERSIVRATFSLHALVLDDRALARLPGGLENFRDLDTPEDLAALEQALAARERSPR